MRSCWCLVLLISAGCDGFHSEINGVAGQASSLTLAWGKSCARMNDGSLRCWGNRASSLVEFDKEGSSVPFDVRPRHIPNVSGTIGLATNLVHDCALAADHTVT